jgi:polar amino acid transport system permease protein
MTTEWTGRERKRRRFGTVDLLLALVLVCFVAFSAYRVVSVMHYEWAWQIIPSYFLRWDPDAHAWVTNILLDGLFMTLRISFWGSI